MRKNRIVITGGAGFIGRALVARCLQDDHDVTVIDNLCAGHIGNLEPYLDRIAFCQADILDGAAVKAVMERSQPSIVFHLAAHHFIPFCEQYPSETLRVNVEGTHAVLTEAARQGASTAIIASSGSIYPSQDTPLSEDLAAAPVDVYGLSKHMTEEVARFVVATTKLSCVAARLFNTYGPYETNPHLIPHIIESLRQGAAIRLGNIHTKRDYIHVTDVADLLYRCALTGNFGYTTVNIGTGIEHSAEEIVQTLSHLLEREIAIEIDASRVRRVDKLYQRADTRRLESMTGALPTHSLINGLRKLLLHERLGAERFYDGDIAAARPSAHACAAALSTGLPAHELDVVRAIERS
jgi:UDP-glucose 4-epimerase